MSATILLGILIATFLGAVSSEKCGLEQVSLKNAEVTASSRFLKTDQNLKNIVYGYTNTSVSSFDGSEKTSEDFNWLAISLPMDKQHWFISSVVVTPVRPNASPASKKTVFGDSRDTSICQFPFTFDSKVYQSCTNAKTDFFWCQQDCGAPGCRFSSCADVQPDGSSMDGVEIFISSGEFSTIENIDWNKFQGCAAPTAKLFNRDRTYVCSDKNMVNAKTIILRKKTDFQLANIMVNSFKYDQTVVQPTQPFQENISKNIKLQVERCSPSFNVEFGFWYHNGVVVNSWLKDPVDLNIANVTRKAAGEYYFTLRNENGEEFYKSNTVEVVVNYPSEFPASFEAIRGSIGENFTIECEVDGGRPTPRVEMRLDGQKVECDHLEEPDGHGGSSASCTTFVIMKQSLEGANFTCVKFQAGYPSTSSILSVVEVFNFTGTDSPHDKTPPHDYRYYGFLSFLVVLVFVFIFAITYDRRNRGEEEDEDEEVPSDKRCCTRWCICCQKKAPLRTEIEEPLKMADVEVVVETSIDQETGVPLTPAVPAAGE